MLSQLLIKNKPHNMKNGAISPYALIINFLHMLPGQNVQHLPS